MGCAAIPDRIGGPAPAGAVCALHPAARAIINRGRENLIGSEARRTCALRADCAGDRFAAVVMCRECAARAQKGRYYVVPPARVVALYVVTYGAYGAVWSYRQWRAIKHKDQSSIWPIGRAMFSGITLYLLIHDLNDRAREASEARAALPRAGIAQKWRTCRVARNRQSRRRSERVFVPPMRTGDSSQILSCKSGKMSMEESCDSGSQCQPTTDDLELPTVQCM